MGIEQRFGLGLGQKQKKRVEAGEVIEVDRQDLFAFAKELRPVQFAAARDGFVGDAISLELLQRSGLYYERLRMLRHVIRLVDDADIKACPLEFNGCGHAGGSGPDDKNG